MRTAAIVFEGGPLPADELQERIAQLRHAVTLDTVEKLQRAGLEVILATNHRDLAEAAHSLGARIFATEAAGFHFGRVLGQAVRESGADAVIYLSGAALPLMALEEIAWICRALAQGGPTVVVNNVQSADLVAWHPAAFLERVEPPENDNLLGWRLREAGMERVLIPHSAAIHFDLDTPTDYLILALSGRGGPRAQAALRMLAWPDDRLRAAADVLATDLPEVALIGRVGSAIMEYINRNLPVRLRVLSEERGMKALGREARGEVRSLVGDLVTDLGPERFFERLGEICDAAFFDTRVLFANRGRRVSEWDRFHSDLGLADQIRDPFVHQFTRAAVNCRIPVVLGGHSVVAGGLWVLADRAIAARGGPAVP